MDSPAPSAQLTLIQGGEFIVCEDVVYESGAITARTSLPVNTMKAVSVRIDNDIVPLPFIRSQERRAVSARIRIDGAVAARIANSLGLVEKRTSSS